MPVSLVAARSLSCRRQVQVENSHPQFKFPHPTSLVATRFHLVGASPSLWRQDFILSGKCKLKTRTHMGKCAPTKGLGRSSFRTHSCLCHASRNLAARGRAQSSQALLPTDSAEETEFKGLDAGAVILMTPVFLSRSPSPILLTAPAAGWSRRPHLPEVFRTHAFSTPLCVFVEGFFLQEWRANR